MMETRIYFFQTFETDSFGKLFNNKQLYYELIECLSPAHFLRISHQLNQSVKSFAAFRKLLVEAYIILPYTKLS